MFAPDLVTLEEVVRENTVATLADLKLAASVDTGDEDDYLNLCLASGQAWVEGYIKRRFADCRYTVFYKFNYTPRDRDVLVLPVAPVASVMLDGERVPLKAMDDGFHSWVTWQEGWDTQTLSLDVSVVWGEKLGVMKLPVLTVASDFYRNRNLYEGRQMSVNQAVTNALAPYRRDI